jgi:signal transduction histidine kinase
MRPSKLERLPLAIRIIIVLAVAALVFAADALTPWDVTLRGLYVIPVALTAWIIGRWAGVAMSLLGNMVNACFDARDLPGAQFHQWVISDTAVQLFIYLSATFVIAALHDAYRAAQRATDARDHVLGVVAHDLRNPLASIVLAVKVVQPTATNGPARALVSMERAVQRMNRLIADLLDVTSIESEGLSLELAHEPTRRVVLDALEAPRSLAEQSGVELRLEMPETLPDVWADRHRLLQILDNLIGNALKFTGRGGTITVSVTPNASSSEVLFAVKDTGAGIQASDLAHVFDRFWQAAKAERHGAGLGLAIVKGLVEAHGGRVRIESASGTGTTVFFTIPTRPLAKRVGFLPAHSARPA